MSEFERIRQQVPSLARAIAATEAMVRTASGQQEHALRADLDLLRKQLVFIDEKLYRTPFYPCNCGRRMTNCPNQTGGMRCNLADKRA